MNISKINDVVSSCTFGDWNIITRLDGDQPYLQIQANDTCSVSGKPYKWSGRKWMLSTHMTESEIVQTAFAAVLMAVEHEAREKFKYDDEPVFRPHFDVAELYRLSFENKISKRVEHG